jgi:hypothetical protein
MKIHRVVTMLGATTTTGKLASDMYDLNDKTYYSEAEGRDIPISHMDFQHMVRAFVKLTEKDNVLVETLSDKVKDQDRGRVMRIKELKEDLKKTDDIIENNDKIYKKNLQEQEDKILALSSKITNLLSIIEEKESLLEKEIISKDNWRNAYYDDCSTRGSRYIFTEIPNNEYGKKLTRGMKVYLNDESYTMRVRGQHIKPELKGTGATYWGQSIEQSTHLRVYIDKKKGA